MRQSRRIAPLMIGSLILTACGKSAAPSADSADASSTTSSTSAFDENAARAQILANDSAFVRGMVTRNVDSIMPYYDPSVVSLGKTAVKGTSNLRTSYSQAVKTNVRDVSFLSGGVNFSNDHSMAWDYGTVSQTADGPNGKPLKTTGTYLNVWKNVGGRWMIVAEISSLSP